MPWAGATDLLHVLTSEERASLPCWSPSLRPRSASVRALRTLEPQIERREAELGAAEHGGRFLEVVACVGADRMDVTPGPLDRVVEKDSAATASFEQAIDGAHTPIRPLGGIPPIARSLGERYLCTIADQSHRFGKVAEQALAGGGHLGCRFGQRELHERVLGDSALVAGGDACRRLVAKRRERPQRDADRRGTDTGGT